MTEGSLTTMRFDEFAERVNETVMPAESDLNRYIGLEHLNTMDLTIRRWDEGRNLVGQKKIVRKGDIIIARRNWYLRRVAIAPFDALCSAHAMIVRPKKDAINPDFFPFFLLSNQFFQKALAISVGSLSPTINWSTLRTVEFDFPSESVIEEMSKSLPRVRILRDNLENTLLMINRSWKSITRELTLTRPDVVYPKQLESADLPHGWKWMPLIKAVEFLNNKRIPLNSKERNLRQGEYPYYGASGVVDHIDDYIFDEELLLVSEDGANLIDRNHPVCFRISGRTWVNNHAHVLRIKPGYDIDFIEHQLESINYRPLINGTAQPKLNLAALKSISIPIPDYETQTKIGKLLANFVSFKNSLKNKILSVSSLQSTKLEEALP